MEEKCFSDIPLLKGIRHCVVSTSWSTDCWRPHKVGVSTVTTRDGSCHTSSAAVPLFRLVGAERNSTLAILISKGDCFVYLDQDTPVFASIKKGTEIMRQHKNEATPTGQLFVY